MSSPGARRSKKAAAAFSTSLLALAASAAMLGPGTGAASSHREAPLTLADPQADNTDVYAFVSPDKAKTVTLIADWIPFEEPSGGPNFYPWSPDAHYDINVDTNGDANADITYRWTFQTQDKRGTNTFLYNNGPVNKLSDPTLLYKQTYTLQAIKNGHARTLVGGAPVAPSNVGMASMPNYASLRAQSVLQLKGGFRSFAGQADDPFFLDLRIFDLLYGGDLSEAGADTLTGYNVNSVALQIPIKKLTHGGDPVIGVWSTTERPSMRVQGADGTQKYNGSYVQVSRLGNPLVNEVVVPAGLKDAFNALPPVKDATVKPIVQRVLDPEVPKLIQAIYKLKAPATPRNDLFSIFLTGIKGLNRPAGKVHPAEMLRLNTSIPPSSAPNRLGVLAKDTAGFPNGRRLTDDVVDIELQALEGAARTGKIVPALAAGDGVNANDVAFGSTFPYLALPHSGSGTGAGNSPTGGVGAGGGGTATTAAAPAQQSSPVLPLSAAALGLGLAGLGVVLLRRDRSDSAA